ncbi:MAG: hypothetical protein JWO33_2687, partial [Caulobacteraceae bacterium]|nr:hypothetical protein [Caulobacteraceae bacterium]
MRTLQPVIAPGTTEWDQALFTPAEFQARLARLQAFVAAQGWAGAVLYGDAEGASLFSWITGFFPRIRWSMALVPAVGGDLRLLLGVAPRDLNFARELTWLSDPATYDKLPAVLPGWLEGLGPGRTLGLAGRDHIPFETYDRLRALSPG